MGYGASSKDIKDVQYLSYGEYENGKIAEISAGLKKRQKSDETDDVCDIMFKHIQGQFQLRVFNPDNDEDEERKAKNQKYTSELFAYIAKKLTNKEVVIPDTISSWKELTDYFLKVVGPKEEYSKVNLNFKLVGNVYQGKANIQVTRYFGWLERADSGKKPKFSSNEIAANNAYAKHMAERQPNSSASSDTTDSSGDETEIKF